MTYTAPGAMTFRRRGGDLDKKITDELALIDAETDSLRTGVNSLAGDRVQYTKVILTAGNANAFCMAWANPRGTPVIILKFVVQIVTQGGTPGAVLDFGIAANGTTHADNLLDGIDGNAAGVYDNITNKGDNGKTVAVMAADQYITGQILTQNAGALVAVATIVYA